MSEAICGATCEMNPDIASLILVMQCGAAAKTLVALAGLATAHPCSHQTRLPRKARHDLACEQCRRTQFVLERKVAERKAGQHIVDAGGLDLAPQPFRDLAGGPDQQQPQIDGGHEI